MRSSLFILAAAFLFIRCSDGDSIPTKLTNGAPQWNPDYPAVAYGATTVDFNLSTDRASKVFYVITEEDLNLSAHQVISKSKSPDTSVKFSGVVKLEANDTVRETVDIRFENKKYFTYLVAQNVGDSLYTDAVKNTFTTYVRQDTIEYVSAVESRTVKALVYRTDEFLKYPQVATPVCYFLGGKSEMAKENKPLELISNGTLPESIYLGNDVPMMVISIQHIQDWNLEFIDEAINYGNSNYKVDAAKVYLTGIGEGASAVWDYAKAFSSKVTAVAPISGKVKNENACNLKNIATWAFSNDIDYDSPKEEALSIIASINDCEPSKEAKVFVFPDPGHNCWKRIYNPKHSDWQRSPAVEPFDIFAWFLTYSK